MKAFLISCNDSAKAVVLDKKKVRQEVLKLRLKHLEEHKHIVLMEEYNAIYTWHTHEVNVVK